MLKNDYNEIASRKWRRGDEGGEAMRALERPETSKDFPEKSLDSDESEREKVGERTGDVMGSSMTRGETQEGRMIGDRGDAMNPSG